MLQPFESIDNYLVGWANPLALDPANRLPARENWALNSIDQALFIVVGYLTILALCFFFLYDAKAEKIKQDAAKRAGKKKKFTVSQKFAKTPIVWVAMVIYNAVQVGLCAYMVNKAAVSSIKRDFLGICNEHKLDLSDGEQGIAEVLHVFFLTKVLDFADTMFMVVKGNWRQISFLHVYHHSSVFMIYWLILNAGYDGDIYLTIVLNGFIHLVMYSYYLATTFNIQVPVAVKMMVTNMQLLQFVAMIVQAIALLTMGCEYPRNLTIMYLFYIISMFALFSHFKRKTYSARDKRKKAGSRRAGDEEPITS